MKRFSMNSVCVQQGSRVLFSDFVDGGFMWTGQGDRESRHIIKFKEKYATVPAVMVSISMWDMDHDSNSRAEILAENITESEFHLVFKTWGDTRVARIRADWTAIGQVADEDDWDVH